MSFRDTFTRSSNSSQNLRYDDAAAYHFYITILIIVVIPLGWSLIKTLLNPFSHIPTLSQLEQKRQFRQKISKFKKENRYAFLTFKFVLKILVFLAILYGIIVCANTIIGSKDQIKGFDPYQILGVEHDAPIERIKKAYRKLALLYHPDRNPDNPEASAKFIMISKAYECLTDQEAKEKCLKYGNPDGSSSFNVGIALPEFLVRKQNHLIIMGVVFILVVIVLPIYLIHYHSEMNKYDDFGMLAQNEQIVGFSMNQQFSMKDAVKMVACCLEFSNLATTSDQIPKLQVLLKQLTEQERKALTKKNYKGYIKKALLLIDARMNEKEVSSQLVNDYKFIMKKTPIIIKSSIHRACAMSGEYAKMQNALIGKNCVKSLILFQQYFIQGKNYEFSESFMQLDLSNEQVSRVLKKKKSKKITDLKTLQEKEEERDYFLSLLDSNRSTYIKECLQYFPTLELECEFKVEDQSVIGAGDFFQVIITIKTNRLSNFCSAVTYPFLKMEGWHLIVSDSTSICIIQHEFFNFDELTKSFKVTYRQEHKGKYSLNVSIMSDCYFGLDIERDFKYQVTGMKAHRQDKDHEEDEQHQESYIQKLFSQLIPKEEEEVSDDEDESKKEKDKVEKPKQIQQVESAS